MQLRIAHIGICDAEVDVPDMCPKCKQPTNTNIQGSHRMPLMIRGLPESSYNRVYEQVFVIKSDLVKYTKGIFQIICGNRNCNHIFYSAFGDGAGTVATKEELEQLKALLEL